MATYNEDFQQRMAEEPIFPICTSSAQPSLYCPIIPGFRAKEMLDPYFWYNTVTSLMGSPPSTVQANAYDWLID